MKKRFLYIAGLVLLVASATLVIWQGSFTFGEYAPTSPGQTVLYWSVSTLVFLLTVTLGFMLFRTGARLYVERRSNREGSRIKTKLVIGALALSFLPVFFLVLWSVSVLNRNLDKWFSRPAEGIRLDLQEIGTVLAREARERAEVQAAWLAAHPELKRMLLGGLRPAAPLERLCREREIPAATVLRSDGAPWFDICGSEADLKGLASRRETVRQPIELEGHTVGLVLVPARPRIDVVEKQREIQRYVAEYDRLAIGRKETRRLYLMLLALITLFILFVATWIALFLARQISNPIAALLDAAGQVRSGNLAHRVQTQAVDELATLVRGFNEMTQALEANSQELERRRRFTEAILESIPSGVISVSSDGRIQRVNRALRQILPAEKVDRAARLEDLFSREDTAELRYMMKRARRTGVASRQFEIESGHGTLHLAATAAALEEKAGSGFVLVLEDTSELLRAQKAAAWQEVVRRIAHEIKNPLTPIALGAERVAYQLDRTAVPAEFAAIVRECTATIAREVESVKTLVNQFSQLAGFPTAQPAPADLNEVVADALTVFAGRLDGVELDCDLAPRLPPANLDRELFKRAVVNLVDNAAEAMQDSPLKRLYVATQAASPDTLELIIADTGCGVSPEEKEKLFLPYFSTKGRGTGLGLAIVNQILTDHKATIRVEDNVPAGARFIVEIPALETAGEGRG
ncbi:MAG: ATP-binding protein [Acidobacteriota bacterium]